MNTLEAINRIRDVLRRQQKALATEDTYIFRLRRYMASLPKMPKDLSSEQKIERFLTDQARYHGVSVSSRNQSFNAILYFYKHVLNQTIGNVDALRAQRPIHMRHSRRRFSPEVARSEGVSAGRAAGSD
jgi:hypothetical protein